MAVIYLRHPRHGDKVACSDQEAAYDRGNGWVDFTPSPTVVPDAEAPVEPEQPVEEEKGPPALPEMSLPVPPFAPAPEALVPSFLAPPVVADLPADFPGRESLIEAGFLTWVSLVDKTSEQLQEIKGIGPATAKAILEVLEG